MVKARLIAVALLAAGALALVPAPTPVAKDDAGVDESDEWQRFSATCASASLRTSGETDPDRVAEFWAADVSRYTTTKSGPPCDSAADCASSRLAVADEQPPIHRADDRSGCSVNDFWTADVRGLYTLSGAAVVDTAADPAIRLIELSVASEDTDPDEGWTPEDGR
jgi:hypothetical protein